MSSHEGRQQTFGQDEFFSQLSSRPFDHLMVLLLLLHGQVVLLVGVGTTPLRGRLHFALGSALTPRVRTSGGHGWRVHCHNRCGNFLSWTFGGTSTWCGVTRIQDRSKNRRWSRCSAGEEFELWWGYSGTATETSVLLIIRMASSAKKFITLSKNDIFSHET